jgi:hypothetical protein
MSKRYYVEREKGDDNKWYVRDRESGHQIVERVPSRKDARNFVQTRNSGGEVLQGSARRSHRPVGAS